MDVDLRDVSVLLDDQQCVEMMRTFIAEAPELWNEDIGV